MGLVFCSDFPRHPSSESQVVRGRLVFHEVAFSKRSKEVACEEPLTRRASRAGLSPPGGARRVTTLNLAKRET